MSEAVIGVDLGASSIKAGRVTEAGEIVARLVAPTPPNTGVGAVLDLVASLVAELCDGAAVERVGIGSCGLVDRHGVVRESTATLPGWEGVDLGADLQARVGLPCVADNDGNAAAWGEATHGAGQGARSLALLTLGTGVGGGVVLDGRLWHGAGSMAGTFGHLPVVPNGAECACGARGCLEAYASAWALRRAAGVDADEVFRRSAAQDPVASRLVIEAGDALGVAFAQIAHTINPGLILIGGGIAAGWEQLREPAHDRFREAALKRAFATTRVERAALGSDAGLIGAARLPPLTAG